MLRYLVMPIVAMPVLLALLAGPASAADLRVKPAAAPASADAIKNQASGAIDTLGLLRAENQKLRAQVKTLSQQLSDLKYDKPFCSDTYTSSNKEKNMTRDCSPMACDSESGACIAVAHSTDDCAPGYAWDSTTNHCDHPPPPAPDGGL